MHSLFPNFHSPMGRQSDTTRDQAQDQRLYMFSETRGCYTNFQTPAYYWEIRNGKTQ